MRLYRVDEAARELMRDFADWIYKRFETEYDYRMSTKTSTNRSATSTDSTNTARFQPNPPNPKRKGWKLQNSS